MRLPNPFLIDSAEGGSRITLRDLFAGLAMAGLCARPSLGVGLETGRARDAYAQADAALAVRAMVDDARDAVRPTRVDFLADLRPMLDRERALALMEIAKGTNPYLHAQAKTILRLLDIIDGRA